MENITISNIDIPGAVTTTTGTANQVEYSFAAMSFDLDGTWQLDSRTGVFSFHIRQLALSAGLTALFDGSYMMLLPITSCTSTLDPSDVQNLSVVFEGSFNQSLRDEIVAKITETLTDSPDTFVCDGIMFTYQAYVGMYIATVLNLFARTTRENGYPQPFNISQTWEPNKTVDNRDIPLFDAAETLLNDFMGLNGTLSMNEIGEILTNGTGVLRASQYTEYA
jgi:hypothetical protein